MILLIPFGQDPLAAAARQIIEHHQAQLPDLTGCLILVADSQCSAALRAALLDQAKARGLHALLGPDIQCLDIWLQQFPPSNRTIFNRAAQELILGDALRQARQLYADTDPWLLADQLLALFDELTHNQISVPSQLETFTQELQDGYGLPGPAASLQQEAGMLHTLWHAWRTQLDAEGALDPASAYLLSLQRSLRQTAGKTIWLLGFTGFTRAELDWLNLLLERQQAHLLVHGNNRFDGMHPDAPLHALCRSLGDNFSCTHTGSTAAHAYPQFFEALFNPAEVTLQQRAQQFAVRQPQDPLDGRLHICCTDNPELEARAVALQIRRWLLAGKQPLAVVTADRRLARRVRAMLEASQITLDDPAGWALSTTSAAAIVERWLETVEEDFACGPLLDVLKSPFLGGHHRPAHLALVRRFEQDIVLHENIARSLDRYRRHLELRYARLPGDWSEQTHHELHNLLNRIDQAASHLLPLREDSHPVLDFITALQASLQELEAWQALSGDAAGQDILAELEQLRMAAAVVNTRLDWQEFRNWLGRSLERATFRTPGSNSPVKLLTLEQTRLQHFAGLVIAGCSRDYLPGAASGQAFFNQRVRSQLGLPTWRDRAATTLHHFVRSLHSADQLLLTRHREHDGEPVAASPWLELLEAFHTSAYGRSLEDAELQLLLRTPAAYPVSPDTAPLPSTAARPAPALPPARLPRSWTAYSHQRLLDCPYRFYAADGLGLKPQDEIREALSKADYGSLLHRVLQAFHSKVRGLPGPWSGPLQDAQRAAAIQLLERISDGVFAPVIADDFQARGWLQQWRSCLPTYIDWQIQRQRDWQLAEVEIRAELAIAPGLHLRGRIDRIDQQQGALGIIDYKTGTPPGSAQVLAGEAVQLPSYALLLGREVRELDYLQIGRGDVTLVTAASGDAVGPLISAVGDRIQTLQAALQKGATLPAWGDESVCGYCEFSGLCRREMWRHEAAGDE